MGYDAKEEAAKLVRVRGGEGGGYYSLVVGDVAIPYDRGSHGLARGNEAVAEIGSAIASALSRAYAAGLDRAADIALAKRDAAWSKNGLAKVWDAADEIAIDCRLEAEKARTP